MNFIQSIGSFLGFGGKTTGINTQKTDQTRVQWTIKKTESEENGVKVEHVELCEDMIFEIFAHIENLGKQDLGRGMLVCKAWTVILVKNNLWEKVFEKRNESLPRIGIPMNYFYQYESFHAHAKLIDRSNQEKSVYYDRDKGNLKEYLGQYDSDFYRHLHSLHLSSFNGLSDRANLNGIKYLIDKCPSLELLDFSGLRVDERIIVVAVGYFKSRNKNNAVIQLGWGQNNDNVKAALNHDKRKQIQDKF